MAAAAPQGRLLQALAPCGAFPARCVPSLVTGPSSFGQPLRVLSIGQEGFLSPGLGPMPAGKCQQQQALRGCSGLGWETSALSRARAVPSSVSSPQEKRGEGEGSVLWCGDTGTSSSAPCWPWGSP